MAIIKKYKSQVFSIENPIPGVYVVEFASLEKPFKYLPGQFLHLAIDEYDPSQQWPESRCFSMQSNSENEKMKITFSIKGQFTQRMAHELKPGKIVYLKLPYGDLFAKNYAEDQCVFIAGGTGITPFLSLFTHSCFADFNKPFLYFGVRDLSHNLYSAELKNATDINSQFCFSVISENTDGRLDIKKMHEMHGNNAVYFISGPPVMIKNFREYLLTGGVPSNYVVTDDWE